METERKCIAIGRIYYAHPTSGPRFFFRTLLNYVQGARTYDEIKTYNRVLYNTYKAACIARGLLEDDKEWHKAIDEASFWETAKRLRHMFVELLVFSDVTDAYSLWRDNWALLTDDVVYYERKRLKNNTLSLTEDQIRNYGLCEIELFLNKRYKSLRDFDIPVLHLEDHLRRGNPLLLEEMDYNREDLKSEYIKNHAELNEEQKLVFDSILDAMYNETGGFFFVYGSGGTEKTFLWKTILAKLRSEGKIVLVVASSGIASLLLAGGRTAHSRFNIPLNVDQYSTCNISQKTDLAKLIQKTDLIIWDEAPMNNRHVFEAIDKTFRDLMRTVDPKNEEKVFGGKAVALGGDFRQILPVVERGSREDIVASSISKSNLWDECKIFVLKQNMRLTGKSLDEESIRNIKEFNSWVLNLGEGKLPTIRIEDGQEPCWIKIPDDLLIPESDNPIEDIVSEIYKDIHNNFKEDYYLRDRCILAPTNQCVDEINSYILSKLPGETHQFRSADTISPVSEQVENQSILYPTEFLNTLQISGIPNHVIEMKVGVPIMLLRNTNPAEGMCNRTRLIVTHLGSRIIRGTIITGGHVGSTRTIPRIVMTTLIIKWPFILRRTQFPVKVCFGMTINKSQGQTLKHVGLYLPTPVFTHGQLYVAASRVTSRKGLKILIKKRESDPIGYTKNVVYKEVSNNLVQDDNS